MNQHATTVKQPIRHLYIHYPVCAKICPYCSFYVHTSGAKPQKDLVTAICNELALAQKEFSFDLNTIYFGGGTPSMLPADLFSQLASALPKHNATEFTIEVNPATVTETKAAAWKAAGVNRVSLGAQSFDAEFLQLLGRQHSPSDIPETMKLLRSLGFSNINIDLMFALPSQPRETWVSTLNSALACEPDHISAYALTYEEDTPFFKNLKSGEFNPNEENEIWMFEKTIDLLTAAGLPPYEISNFAKPGKESAHNRAYWNLNDYLGVGPSAVSTINNVRWKNVPDSKLYIHSINSEKIPRTETETLSPEIRRRERILLGLRTTSGIARSEIESTTSAKLVSEDLLALKGENFVLTPRGRLLADAIAQHLF